MKTLPLFFLAAGLAAAQPVVNAVVNAASNALPGLPNSAVAQGAIFIVYGTNLGPAAIQQAVTYPLPVTLANTSAQITVNGTTTKAIMIYTLATQIAGILPSSTPTGTGTITVTYNGQASAPAPITVVQNNFGTFAVNQAGSGEGIVTFADYSLVSPTKAANPGETLIIWGTGLGPVQGDEAASALPGDMPNVPVQLYVGGAQAAISYRGRSGCCAGLDQIAFVVPANVTGCSVPLAVQIGSSISNFTSFAIASSGRACSDPTSTVDSATLQALLGKGSYKTGVISLERLNNSTTLPLLGTTVTKSDEGFASFAKYTITNGTFPTNFFGSTSFGACTVSTYVGVPNLNLPGITITPLSAGNAITINGPGGTRTLALDAQSKYFNAKLGDGTPGNYLDPGTYTISGPGGADVGAFSTSITLPASFVWTNQAAITAVNRSAGQPITWTGGDPTQYVIITGSSTALLTGTDFASGSFTCYARNSDGAFTIPPVVLLSLPVTGTMGIGTLSVGTSITAKPFTAPGLDYAIITAGTTISQSANYQ